MLLLKFIAGLATGALLTLTGLAVSATFKGREQVSGVDVLEDECREATERFRVTRATIDKIEKEQKAQIEALCEVLRMQRDAATAAATASETVVELASTAVEPVSDNSAEN